MVALRLIRPRPHHRRRATRRRRARVGPTRPHRPPDRPPRPDQRHRSTPARTRAYDLIPKGRPLLTTRHAPTLIALIGPPGAGKTTLAANLTRHHPGLLILSSDATRAALSPYGDESDQAVTPQAVAHLRAELDRALAARRTVLVDATNSNPGHRRALLDIATRYQAYTVAIVLLPELQVALARNDTRSPQAGPCGWARRVPTDIVTAMHTAITEALPHLLAEGWNEIHHLSSRRDLRAKENPMRVNIRPADCWTCGYETGSTAEYCNEICAEWGRLYR